MNEEITRDVLDSQQVEREVHQTKVHRDELVERITRVIREDGRVEPLKGLTSPVPPLQRVRSTAWLIRPFV